MTSKIVSLAKTYLEIPHVYLAGYFRLSRDWARENIERKTFLQALAGFGVLWVILIAYMLIQTDNVKETINERLDAQTALIPRSSLSDIAKISPLPEIEQSARMKSADKKIPKVMEGLAPAPIEGLYTSSPFGVLPTIRGADGLTPFDAYKRSFNYNAAHPPFIALILRNYGLSESLAAAAIQDLPPEVSFLVSPYSPSVSGIGLMARNNGHETWLEVPVELKDYQGKDTGPKTIMAHDTLDNNLNKLQWGLGLYSGYAGVASYYDGAFEGSEDLLEKFFKNLFGYGIGYIDINKDAHGIAQKISLFDDYPYTRVTDIIEDPRRLSELEDIAAEKGFALGVINLTIQNLPLIKDWIRGLKEKGITLTPASAIVEAPSQMMRRQHASPTPALAEPEQTHAETESPPIIKDGENSHH